MSDSTPKKTSDLTESHQEQLGMNQEKPQESHEFNYPPRHASTASRLDSCDVSVGFEQNKCCVDGGD